MKEVIILKESTGVIREARDIFKNIKEMNIDYAQENFIVFFLDSKNKIINAEVLFKGGLNSCLIDPKTIFRIALLHNSNGIIVAHNHPSGDLTPSDEDKNIYESLQMSGEFLDLRCMDSIIFNEKEYYSMNSSK